MLRKRKGVVVCLEKLREESFQECGICCKKCNCKKKQGHFRQRRCVYRAIRIPKGKVYITRYIKRKIGILPGIIPVITEYKEEIPIGGWFTFVGRVSEEKGIYEFIEAAKQLPHLTFKVAGNLDRNFEKPVDMPRNVEFVGFLKGRELDNLYRKSRAIVVPSNGMRVFPMS